MAKSKRSSPFKIKYPRVLTNTKKYRLSASGYFTTAPGFGKTPHPPTNTIVTGNDYVAQGKSPDNWKHLVAICQNATSNHNGRLTQCKPIEGSSLVTYADKSVDVISGVIDTSCYSIPDPTPGLSANAAANNLAKARLLKTYIRRMNTWRGGNFIAELRETIEALKHPVRSFYRATYSYAGKVRTLGKVYRRNPHQYGKELANAWLAYFFGLRPLVDDMNDLARTLHRMGTSSYSRTKLYGSGNVQTSTVTQPVVNWAVSGHPGSPTQKQDRVEVESFHVHYKGAIRTRTMNSHLLIQEFGVDIFDVVPAVWEAIPWSFLVDYFINVQEVLDGMRYVNADLAWLMSSVRNERTTETSGPIANHATFSPGAQWSCVGGGGQTLSRMHTRTALSTMPYPSWQFRIPGLTSLKWLNIAALSQQIRESKPIAFEQYRPPRRGKR